MTGFLQASFSRGEVTPEVHGRIDLAFYPTAVSLALNFFVKKSGGLSNRPGLRMVAEIADSSEPARIQGFQFSTTQSYVLEFGGENMRVYRNGGQVLYPSGHASEGLPVDVTVGLDPDILNEINFEQTADVLDVVHTSFKHKLITRQDHHIWTVTENTYAPGIIPVSTITVTPTYVGSPTLDTVYNYAVTAESEIGEESLPFYSGDVTNIDALDKDNYVTVDFSAVSEAVRYNIYKKRNGLFGYIGSSEDLTFRDDGIAADVGDTPQQARQPFDAVGDYPGAVGYWQQRTFLGGTDNNSDGFEASQTGALKNFSISEPLKATDAIIWRNPAGGGNRIRHFLPLADSMLLLTSGEAFALGLGSDGLTPSLDGGVLPQFRSRVGYLPPLKVGNTALFYSTASIDAPTNAPTYLLRQKPFGSVQELTFDGISGKFGTIERSVLSSHLIEKNKIVSWAYAQDPYSIIWAVRDDGKLLSLTHMGEHEVYGWTQHETDGFFESVCVVEEGDESAVYFIVRRRINGVQKRFLERMASRRFDEVADAFFLDCGLTYDVPVAITGVTLGATNTIINAPGHGVAVGDSCDLTEILGSEELNGKRYRVVAVSGDLVTIAPRATAQGDFLRSDSYGAYLGGGVLRRVISSLSGADHLAGATVSMLIDGKFAGQMTWAAGSNALPTSGSRVHVGLPYVGRIKTLSVVAEPDIYTRKKGINHCDLWLRETRGLAIGPSFDRLNEVPSRSYENWYQAPELKTGLFKFVVPKTMQVEGQVCIEQAYPLPMEVSTIIPDVQIV